VKHSIVKAKLTRQAKLATAEKERRQRRHARAALQLEEATKAEAAALERLRAWVAIEGIST